MCVDFTDLNKAYPNNSFPFVQINLIVDSMARHWLFSLMEAYSGYNQTRINLNNAKKTFFVTEHGLYCYLVMLFTLKNVGTTYQWLVNQMRKNLIWNFFFENGC